MSFKEISYFYLKEEYKQYILLFFDKKYYEIMEYASCNGHIEVVKLMIKYSTKSFNTIKKQNKEYNVFILKQRLNSFNKSLVNASKYNHIEIVKLMLKYRANSFSLAIKSSSNTEIVKLLLSKRRKPF